ncbi:MAG: hypothetical protein VX899_20285 [Myxococcota bacterium]|nr:hypothetical protein [Myxococcota bacterium]
MLLSLLTALSTPAQASEAPAPSAPTVTAPAHTEAQPWTLEWTPQRYMPIEIGPNTNSHASLLLEQAWWWTGLTLGMSLATPVILSGRSGINGQPLDGAAELLSGGAMLATVPASAVGSFLCLYAAQKAPGRRQPYLGAASLGMWAAGMSVLWGGELDSLLGWSLIAASPALAFAEANLSLVRTHERGSGAGAALTLRLAQGLTVLAAGSTALLWAGYGASEVNVLLGGVAASFALPVLASSAFTANLLLLGHSSAAGEPLLLGVMGMALAVVGTAQMYGSEGSDWLTGAGMLTLAPVLAGAQWARIGQDTQLAFGPAEGGGVVGVSGRF